jgi:hypothetical protein
LPQRYFRDFTATRIQGILGLAEFAMAADGADPRAGRIN